MVGKRPPEFKKKKKYKIEKKGVMLGTSPDKRQRSARLRMAGSHMLHSSNSCTHDSTRVSCVLHVCFMCKQPVHMYRLITHETHMKHTWNTRVISCVHMHTWYHRCVSCVDHVWSTCAHVISRVISCVHMVHVLFQRAHMIIHMCFMCGSCVINLCTCDIMCTTPIR